MSDLEQRELVYSNSFGLKCYGVLSMRELWVLSHKPTWEIRNPTMGFGRVWVVGAIGYEGVDCTHMCFADSVRSFVPAHIGPPTLCYVSN